MLIFLQGNNKTKNGRKHSWDGKVTEEFVPRHLPLQLAKLNNFNKIQTIKCYLDRFEEEDKRNILQVSLEDPSFFLVHTSVKGSLRLIINYLLAFMMFFLLKNAHFYNQYSKCIVNFVMIIKYLVLVTSYFFIVVNLTCG